MTESVRERAARAIGDARWGVGEWGAVPDVPLLYQADAVLAVVANTDEIAAVLTEHRTVSRHRCFCGHGFTSHMDRPRHQAEAVTAYIRGAS